MYTSYFGNLRKLPEDIRQISICRNPPSWFKGEILYQTAIPLSGYDGKLPIISTDSYRASRGMVVVLTDKPVNKFSVKLLAPMSKSFNEYLDTKNFEVFKENYRKEVLWRLDANKIEREIGERACLTCFEVDDLECHRSVAREWFNKSKVECTEF